MRMCTLAVVLLICTFGDSDSMALWAQESPPLATPQRSDSIIAKFDKPEDMVAPDDQVNPFIYNGVALRGQDPVPDAMIVISGDGNYCTGVLISPTAIVTAGHCLCGSPKVQAAFGLIYSQTNSMPLDASRSTGLFDCSASSDPDHDPIGSEHDIGVVFLKHSASIAHRKIATEKEISGASKIEIFGYGKDLAHKDAEEGVKRRAQVPVSGDHRCGAAPGVGDALSAHCQKDWEMILGTTTTGAGICKGDSGGPAYVEISEMEPPLRYVAAIASRFLRPCGRGSIYVRLDGPALKWLSSIVSDM